MSGGRGVLIRTANYTTLARSGLVLDMSLYYEAWPLDRKPGSTGRQR